MVSKYCSLEGLSTVLFGYLSTKLLLRKNHFSNLSKFYIHIHVHLSNIAYLGLLSRHNPYLGPREGGERIIIV
jgi:hypothetical protein